MLKLSFEKYQELLFQDCKKSEEENLAEGIYHNNYHSQLDTPFCKGTAQNISIRNEITLIQAELTFFEDVVIEMKSFQPQIGIWYCIKGEVKAYRQNVKHLEKSKLNFSLSPATAFIYATAASEGWMHYRKAKPYKGIFLIFDYQIFKQLIGEQIDTMPKEFLDAIEDENGFYMKPLSFTSQTKALCESIFDNPYSRKSRQFYREAKVIELLAYQVDQLTKPIEESNSSGVKLTSNEEKLIEYCKHILISSLADPPSLIELAKEVGMSTYRLKNGFKQMFGETPYRFIVDQRMVKARQLLLQKKFTVSEVALAVGFSSIGTFSNTFYEKYGIRPSDM